MRGSVGGLKLGLEFFNAHGPDGVRPFLDMGLPVFLDLKYHDIPNTVAGAARAAAALGVSILNVHAQGGAAMMRAALEAVKSVSPSTKLIAVTMLTSLSDEDLPSVGPDAAGGRPGAAAGVADPAMRAWMAWCVRRMRSRGCAASWGRTSCWWCRASGPPAAMWATRSGSWARPRRVAAGASMLVIGRPITGAPDPA